MREDGFNLGVFGVKSPRVEQTLECMRQLIADNHIPQRFPFYRNPKKYSTLHLKYDEKIIIETKNLFVISHSFEEAYKENTLKTNSKAIVELVNFNFPYINIFKVMIILGSIYVFYNTTKDKEKYDKDGTSDDIRNVCFRYIKDKDEYGYFQKEYNISFHTDSDEKVKQEYEGNYYYYFK
jgi:hypothetical protein